MPASVCYSIGSHRLELEGVLEKSLKIKSALKSTGKSFKGLEKLLNSSIFCGLNSVDRDLNQYKIVVPLFGAANAAPNKATTIRNHFLVLISPLSRSSISEIEF